jgi:Ni/Fe-hydrogenase 1 B-type cytochrome subunit
LDRKSIKRTFFFYTFVYRDPPGDVGHNALAAIAYSGIWSLLLIEIVTGFAMSSLYHAGWPQEWFRWVFLIISPQATRLIHRLIMWLLLGFVIFHVYSGLLMDVEERSGLMSSMLTGYKSARRSA